MPKFITVFPSPNTQRKLHGKEVNARGTRRWAKTSMRSEVSWFAWSAASECVREPEHVRSGAGGTKHRVWRVCYKQVCAALRRGCTRSMCSAACSTFAVRAYRGGGGFRGSLFFPFRRLCLWCRAAVIPPTAPRAMVASSRPYSYRVKRSISLLK
jgi:hypothetical protein